MDGVGDREFNLRINLREDGSEFGGGVDAEVCGCCAGAAGLGGFDQRGYCGDFGGDGGDLGGGGGAPGDAFAG